MTKDEILNMPAGPEMDLLISDAVLKHSAEEWNKRFWAGYSEYSTDIAAAWQVVEELRNFKTKTQAGHPLLLQEYFWNKTYFAEFGATSAEAPTAPLAICRAALLAVMECDE